MYKICLKIHANVKRKIACNPIKLWKIAKTLCIQKFLDNLKEILILSIKTVKWSIFTFYFISHVNFSVFIQPNNFQNYNVNENHSKMHQKHIPLHKPWKIYSKENPACNKTKHCKPINTEKEFFIQMKSPLVLFLCRRYSCVRSFILKKQFFII